MKFYAQLNENRICIGISQLADAISKENMIEINTLSTDYMFKKYDNGKWSSNKFEPSSTAPINDFEKLKEENKELKQQLEQCQASITELTALASTMLTPTL